MFEACSSKSANCHGLKFWLEGGKYTTNYEVPICCTLSPWGEGTLFSEWGEGTGERVQHPGLGKVPDNPTFISNKWYFPVSTFEVSILEMW